jgi:hypothetical protein
MQKLGAINLKSNVASLEKLRFTQTLFDSADSSLFKSRLEGW